MPASLVRLRPAMLEDLDAINSVVETAVMTWDLPERVKRLVLPSYHYTEVDLKHLEIVVAVDARQHILGVAAWEQADIRDTPQGQLGLLLHGLYVLPAYHHQGIGRQLFQAASDSALKHRVDGLLVKVQQNANGFFDAMGMSQLPAEDAMRHYSNRYWKSMNI